MHTLETAAVHTHADSQPRLSAAGMGSHPQPVSLATCTSAVCPDGATPDLNSSNPRQRRSRCAQQPPRPADSARPSALHPLRACAAASPPLQAPPALPQPAAPPPCRPPVQHSSALSPPCNPPMTHPCQGLLHGMHVTASSRAAGCKEPQDTAVKRLSQQERTLMLHYRSAPPRRQLPGPCAPPGARTLRARPHRPWRSPP